jgi:diphthamide synthase (EF-2-diphthine--ammonia ligase)
MLISYSSAGFSPRDLGVRADHELLSRFLDIAGKWGSHPAFEGGEAETLVLSAPLFPRTLRVNGSVRVEGEYNARYEITEAELI